MAWDLYNDEGLDSRDFRFSGDVFDLVRFA
jgi:hypothetical protein